MTDLTQIDINLAKPEHQKLFFKKDRVIYHISDEYLMGEALDFIPRIPESRALSEEDTIDRICVTEDLIGAFISTGYSTPAQYIYEAESEPDISNSDIVKNDWVYDAKDTGEAWITKPTRMKFLTAVYVHAPKGYPEIVKPISVADAIRIHELFLEDLFEDWKNDYYPEVETTKNRRYRMKVYEYLDQCLNNREYSNTLVKAA